jgi:type III secretion protein Q
MSLRCHLRKLDGRQAPLELLRNQLVGSEIIEFSNQQRYLQVQLTDTQGGEVQAWFCLDAWLESLDAHLPCIPWSEVPLNYLASWLNQLGLSFWVEEQEWKAVHIVPPGSPLPERILAIQAQPCHLLCLDWPPSSGNAVHLPAISANQVPFQLNYVLGHSQLPLDQLVDVAVGDLLLIKHYFSHLTVGGRRLFKLSYYPNKAVIVEEKLENYDQEYFEDEVLHDWASMPVNIEFVLDGRTVTLAEIDGITTGTCLDLPPEVEKNIKIYLNKKLFARGELVALKNGSLAVEVNQLTPTLPSNRVETDVN